MAIDENPPVPEHHKLEDKDIITTNKQMARRSFLVKTGALLVGAGALALGVKPASAGDHRDNDHGTKDTGEKADHADRNGDHKDSDNKHDTKDSDRGHLADKHLHDGNDISDPDSDTRTFPDRKDSD